MSKVVSLLVMNKFDLPFIKILAIIPILIFFLPLVFALNTISDSHIGVFVAVVFGCSFIYDTVKRVFRSKISSIDEWVSIVKSAWLGLLLIAISFIGIYIDIFVFKYFGVGFIWLPCFLSGLWFVIKAEETFKKHDTRN